MAHHTLTFSMGFCQQCFREYPQYTAQFDTVPVPDVIEVHDGAGPHYVRLQNTNLKQRGVKRCVTLAGPESKCRVITHTSQEYTRGTHSFIQDTNFHVLPRYIVCSLLFRQAD